MTNFKLPNGGKLFLSAPVFTAYEKDNGGFLCHKQECHALMYYGLLGRQAYEENDLGPVIQYEGTIDNVTNYRNLIVSISELYGVKPEDMIHHWEEVDAQFVVLSIPKLPDRDKYRFNKISEIITSH